MIIPVFVYASEPGKNDEYTNDEQFLEFLAVFETGDGEWFDPQELDSFGERELQGGNNENE